jgi:hypothetical protein
MPKIEIETLEVSSGCNYPPPFDEVCIGPTWRKLGDAAGGALSFAGLSESRLSDATTDLAICRR